MSKHTGGCHCGKVKVKSDLEPMLVGKCNCRRCRKLTGSVAVSAMFGEDEIETQGETSFASILGEAVWLLKVIFVPYAVAGYLEKQNLSPE